MRRGFNEAPAERGGKRPKPPHHRRARRASMRPPLNAGENMQWSDSPKPLNPASMRPPLNAGENSLAGAGAVADVEELQ